MDVFTVSMCQSFTVFVCCIVMFAYAIYDQLCMYACNVDGVYLVP